LEPPPRYIFGETAQFATEPQGSGGDLDRPQSEDFNTSGRIAREAAPTAWRLVGESEITRLRLQRKRMRPTLDFNASPVKLVIGKMAKTGERQVHVAIP
jgi:hypothetical protein